MNDFVTINGKKAKISFNKSKSERWAFEDASHDTLKILDELLKFQDSSVMYKDGITIIKPLSTIELTSLNITRPANHIGVLRHELPPNTILTYRTVGKKFPTYGIIKSEKNKKIISDFRTRLLNLLSLKV